MSKIMKIDMDAMPPYMVFLSQTCNTFCDAQRTVDIAYNNIQEKWQDKNCFFIGQTLKETGKGIGQFYNSVIEAIRILNKELDKRCAYIEMEKIRLPNIENFEVRIREGSTMNNKIFTDSNSLSQFKKALDSYVDNIIRCVKSLCAKYSEIGASWNDEEYYKFGVAIDEFCKKMQFQVDQLTKISEWLRRKIAILEE